MTRQKKVVWALVLTDDREALGMKATVSLHTSLAAAQRTMKQEISAYKAVRHLQDIKVLYYPDELYAVTEAQDFCLSIERMEIQ